MLNSGRDGSAGEGERSEPDVALGEETYIDWGRIRSFVDKRWAAGRVLLSSMGNVAVAAFTRGLMGNFAG